MLPLAGAVDPEVLPLAGAVDPEVLPLAGAVDPEVLPLAGAVDPEVLPLAGAVDPEVPPDPPAAAGALKKKITKITDGSFLKEYSSSSAVLWFSQSYFVS